MNTYISKDETLSEYSKVLSAQHNKTSNQSAKELALSIYFGLVLSSLETYIDKRWGCFILLNFYRCSDHSEISQKKKNNAKRY